MPDYMYLLESRLSAEQRAAVVRVQELATATEANLYLAGGAVRDVISGMPIRDLDFVLESNPARIVRELQKGGATVLRADEDARWAELILAGDVDASVSAARDEVFSHPGASPETHFSTIMSDLRRRDFSLNAIAISLNAASRGLLLDPTNGLADLERREIRVLSMHSFTNQPVRLLRADRYSVRMGFKLETRTAEWFHLALERGMEENISPVDAGIELGQLAREEKVGAILKAWESHGFLKVFHPQLAKRHPNYDAVNRILRAREELWGLGFRPRLFAPVIRAVLGRLKPRERSSTLSRLQMPAADIASLNNLEPTAAKVVKMLAGRKTAAPRDAYAFLENTPPELIAFLMAESSNSKVLGKIRSYLHKWRPLRQALPSVTLELEAMGVERGPKFDKVIEDFFQAQLAGKARKPEAHGKLLRKLAGIKEPPKKIEEKKKPDKSEKAGKGKGAPPPAPPPPRKGAKASGFRRKS